MGGAKGKEMASDPVTIVIPPDIGPERLQAILDAAGPDLAVSEPVVEAPAAANAMAAVLDRVVAAARDLPQALADSGQALQASSGLTIAGFVLASLALLVVAAGIEWALRRFLLARPAKETHQRFSARLIYGLRWTAIDLAGLFLFVLISLVLSRLFLPDGIARAAFGGMLTVVFIQRLVYTAIGFLFAAGEPGRRLVSVSDGEAATTEKAVVAMLVGVGLFRLASTLVTALTGGGPASVPLQLIALVVWLVAMCSALYAVRHIIGRLIAEGWGDVTLFGNSLRDVAGHWWILASVLACINALAGMAIVVGAEGASGFGGAFAIIFFTPFVLAGIAKLRAERLARATAEERPAVEGWFALAEGGIIVLAVILILQQWDIDPFSAAGKSGLAALAPAVISALCAIIIGVAAWRAIKSFIKAYEEPESDDDHAGEGDGLGKQGSRVGTMLPVLRGFLLTLIFAVTGMVALSALGINIGPMIAGAGIFGLAIGFGSQRLVTDVISGFFYLYEDAFRVGEYIETAQGKGVVESISIRSARLRHHRGPVFTIPFSAMGTIQNHSRDWVKIKFTFEVPGDTDLEQVRKLVKKVGQDLEADPELEGKFIEPLKSQGAISIRSNAYVIGVKYMTKPGEQFVIRRRAYAALQKALKDNGIELFRPSIELSGEHALAGAMS